MKTREFHIKKQAKQDVVLATFGRDFGGESKRSIFGGKRDSFLWVLRAGTARSEQREDLATCPVGLLCPRSGKPERWTSALMATGREANVSGRYTAANLKAFKRKKTDIEIMEPWTVVL